MKKIAIFTLLLFGVGAVQAQTKVNERDIDGIWELRIELREGFLDDEIDEEDNVLARIIMRSVGGLVEGILDNLDISFEFKEDGRCKVNVDVFGVNEVEYTEWYINRRGQLIIEDTDNVHFSSREYWMFEDDILVAYDDDGEDIDDDAFVYLIRVD